LLETRNKPYTTTLPTIMKNIFAIIISLTIGQSSFGQKTPISYVNYEKDNDSIENPLIDWDDRISEITLETKKKFVFWSRPSAISCSTWREYNGTWKRKNDTIIFSDQYEISESDARFDFSNRKDENNYLLKFKTDQNSILSDKKIEIQFVYDYDADIDDIELKMELENDFSLRIPFKTIPNRKKLASIRYEYFLPNGEKRFGYISESNTVNVKEKELPNSVIITFVEKPKTETIYRKTKAIFEDDKIRIISKNKTKSDLPDYVGEIKFKEIYEEQNAE
jgi:hypothetical protein